MEWRAHIIIVAGVCLFLGTVNGYIVNGGFETPDYDQPNDFYDPPLYPPIGWQWQDTDRNLNYVALHSWFIPDPEHSYNQNLYWDMVPPAFEGNYFVLLSTGDAQGFRSESMTTVSSIRQVIHTEPGDVLYGSYFFGTTDYLYFNDTGRVKLITPDPGSEEIIIVQIDIETVGNYSSTYGWIHFEYEFTDEVHGELTLVCEVFDIGDNIYKSYFALDNFRICRGLPMLGDLNRDCVVDILDFDILARSWMADCSQVNTFDDPDTPCELFEFDTLSDQCVSVDQLIQLTDHWLQAWD